MVQLCDNSKLFDEKDLQECMRNAIRTLQDNDEFLLTSNCSERAQVHWLAIYFEKELMKKGYKFKHESGYCIDVEYNRFGSIPDTSKRIRPICPGCESKETCKKYKANENEGAATVDMILHQRGKTQLEDNVLCVEIKPMHIDENAPSLRCDILRIEQLCTSHNTQIKQQPFYQYGLALHLKCNKTFSGVWYHNGEKSAFHSPEIEK